MAADYITPQSKQVKQDEPMRSPGNTDWRESLSTVDLLIKTACLVKKWIKLLISKVGDLNYLVQGGLLYCAFPFNKASLKSQSLSFVYDSLYSSFYDVSLDEACGQYYKSCTIVI